MGLFSNIFGGGKKDAAKAGATAPAPAAGKAPKPAAKEKPAAVAGAEPLIASGTGAMQVKLRLKLAAALRAGDEEAAYTAAKSLAEIQVKAGRRTGARIWSEQADRILARLDEASA